jgi:hypothetical protein
MNRRPVFRFFHDSWNPQYDRHGRRTPTQPRPPACRHTRSKMLVKRRHVLPLAIRLLPPELPCTDLREALRARSPSTGRPGKLHPQER